MRATMTEGFYKKFRASIDNCLKSCESYSFIFSLNLLSKAIFGFSYSYSPFSIWDSGSTGCFFWDCFSTNCIFSGSATPPKNSLNYEEGEFWGWFLEISPENCESFSFSDSESGARLAIGADLWDRRSCSIMLDWLSNSNFSFAWGSYLSISKKFWLICLKLYFYL